VRHAVALFALLCFGLASAAYFVEHHDYGHNNHTNVAFDPKAEKIEVFIVTHSHDDMGWIFPVDKYYRQLVRYILDTMVTSLYDNQDRKFTQVEVGFFQMYWNEVSDFRREQIRHIVSTGQLEFNLGGITMNDESGTTYYEEVNQMTEGALWLKKTLGVTAKSAWHVDPFGHSAATASLWSQIGFSGWGLNRIPYWIKDQMKANKGLEFVWRGSKTLGQTSEIFAHVLDSFYMSPNEMNFNDNSGWDGKYVVDDKKNPDYNVDKLADDFAKMVVQRIAWFRHKKLLIPFGNDFAHWQAVNSFVNMDKLIRYVNANSDHYGITMKYAHVSDYVNAVHALNIEWPVFEGDFFPYNDGPNAFWSGYFTSRQWKKHYLRQSDARLASSEALLAYSKNRTAQVDMESLRLATAINTHHDAVSGTETDTCSNDYDRLLREGNAANDQAMLELAQTGDLMTKRADNSVSYYMVHNQLGWSRTQFVVVPTNSSSATVTIGGSVVPSQVNPTPSYSKDTSKYRLYFLVELAPLASKTYTVRWASAAPKTEEARVDNPFLKLDFDQSTGKLSSITTKGDKPVSVSAKLSLYEYRSTNGTSGQASGAYIFRPATDSVITMGTSNVNLATKDVQFYKKSSGKPFVLSTADTFTSYEDSMAVSPYALSADGVKFAMRRLDDQGGWGQNPSVTYVNWPSSFPLKNSLNDVIYALGSSTMQTSTVTVKFSDAAEHRGNFVATPVVVVTARSDNPVVLTASLTSVDTNGFTAQVKNVDGTNYAGNVYIDYFAVQSGTKNNMRNAYVSAGTVSLGSPAVGKSEVISLGHDELPIDSIIVLTPVTSDSVNFNVIAKSSTSFTAVARRIGSGNSNINFNYVILPREPIVEQIAQKVENKVVDGPYVKEVQQFSKENYGQTIIQYQLNNDVGQIIEVVNEVGPLDIGGRELIARMETSLKSQGIFYTDDNGLEILERKYNGTTQEIVAGNYYPMVQRAIIRDETNDLQLNVLSDSTHGASSLSDGHVEVMLHRRCSSDDGRGVSEVLNDVTSIKPKLWYTLTNRQYGTELQRRLSIVQQFPPTVLQVPSASVGNFTPGAFELPSNVHLMTLKSVENGQLLVRLQHIFAAGEHPTLSTPVKIDLKTLLGPQVNLVEVTEMNLSGTTKFSEVSKLAWKTASSSGQKPIPLSGTGLVIQPMEIRTFLFRTK